MQRIIDRQGDIQQIWLDALATSPEPQEMYIFTMETDPVTQEKVPMVQEHSFLRRGYKIQYTPKTGLYELFHTNSSDYYKYPNDKVIDEFLENGWLQTTDAHQVIRDRKRLTAYNRKIEGAASTRNDSLMTHWRKRREELINNISFIEEKITSRKLI
jgi:hypothetical protein